MCECCQCQLRVANCQLPVKSCHSSHSCCVIEICMRLGASSNVKQRVAARERERVTYKHTHSHTHALTFIHSLATLVVIHQLSLGSFKMQHALSELSKFAFNSCATCSALSLSLSLSLAHSHVCVCVCFYYLWLLQVKWICQICLNNSRQKFVRWILCHVSCNLWQTPQFDLISKFVFDLGSSPLPPFAVSFSCTCIYDLHFSVASIEMHK